ncbi:MAG: alpha/beta hydrolase fold protein [Acidobacteria bacterium OLB17]|nr:MAG: alpha/beta hydrolase fold protein [Acidobacteria bacterium OLB17]MCZ2390137.1 hypothetical protein [Acidobacteriota bacterium]
MAKFTRILKSIVKLVLPVIVLIAVVVIGVAIWLVYTVARPLPTQHILTPDKYGRLSSRAAQITEETWSNKDGSQAHGWLLRGAESAPAVILYHRYGANRSHLLDLGVKINESTNYTVLMPDLRSHGTTTDGYCTFGGCDAVNATAAIDFLLNLRTPTGISLIQQKKIGVYGIELGSLYALAAASERPEVASIALDSVPSGSEQLLEQVVDQRYPFMSTVTGKLALLGSRFYYYQGCFDREPTCSTAKKIADRRVLVLAGLDAPAYVDSSTRLTKCFPSSTRVEAKLDLSPTGMTMINASVEQSEAYDQRLIEFFRASLSE